MTHKRIVHDAKEFAGAFYENERSDVFRATWPKQDDYVAAKWPHFVKGVREVYAELLARPDVAEDEKEMMYEALIDNIENVVSDGAHSPLQIIKNTENFLGDRRENSRLHNAIGRGPASTRAKFRSNAAKLLIPGLH